MHIVNLNVVTVVSILAAITTATAGESSFPILVTASIPRILNCFPSMLVLGLQTDSRAPLLT